ncbi:MAG: hypothetical protein B7Z73_06495 [Planctomycetia bacterium 21-64-5]|nr:MAG: hypothetical protein B7Z73_06495 [Planctomycetia bacterium 21-64-5]
MLACILAGVSCVAAGADEERDEPSPQNATTKRLELMRSLIGEIGVSSPAIESESLLKFGPRPLLRYNDQTRALQGTRQLLDATVWRLSERGRPTALVTLEVYPLAEGTGQLFYEFVSLTPLPFAMQLPSGTKWNASPSELKIGPLAGAPVPANSPAGRLAQMRQLARRFSVEEDLNGEKIACRLLSQPIDRYSDGDASILDGAIFVFANGTNPELGLLLECSDDGWSYGAFRLSSAATFATLDGKQFFAAPAMGGYPYPLSAPYTATNRVIELPE